MYWGKIRNCIFFIFHEAKPVELYTANARKDRTTGNAIVTVTF